ncbi:MAG: hypothetical protein K2X74_00620 [Acetobacteraceae bacterium]|nr:hypothetical protein [Acetobacteraceae bacterium]
MLAAAAALAGCAPAPRGPSPFEQMVETRVEMGRRAMDRATADHRAAVARASEACLALHPRPARMNEEQRERHRVTVLDCFDQRAALALMRFDQRLAEIQRDLEAGIDRDAAATAGPPLGSAGNPIWIRPIR